MPWNSLDFRKGVELKEEVDENEFDDHFLFVVLTRTKPYASIFGYSSFVGLKILMTSPVLLSQF